MIQESPNRWSCLPTSFAMVLGVPVYELIRLIHHDGSEIWWPELPEPFCRRGFHIQEMYDVCWVHFGCFCMSIEMSPTLASGFGGKLTEPRPILGEVERVKRFEKYLLGQDCVLIGTPSGDNRREGMQTHSVAWLKGEVHCPSQGLISLGNFKPHIAIRVD